MIIHVPTNELISFYNLDLNDILQVTFKDVLSRVRVCVCVCVLSFLHRNAA